jgi:hypothetical protein
MIIVAIATEHININDCSAPSIPPWLPLFLFFSVLSGNNDGPAQQLLLLLAPTTTAAAALALAATPPAQPMAPHNFQYQY